jgi:Flp pilus assembly protein TadD
MGLILPSQSEATPDRGPRVRSAAVAIVMIGALSGCSGPLSTDHTARRPSLRVADAALKSGAAEVALRVADIVLAEHPASAPALITRGDALYALGRRDLAQTAYRTAIATDPTAVGAEVGLGRTLAQSDPPAAEAAFLSALTHDPANVVALNNLGVVRDLQGRHAEAQEAYNEALAVAPGSADVQINLGMSLALSDRSAEAVQLLRGVAAVPGANQAWRPELLAGLTLAGDGAWAQQMLQSDPVQTPQGLRFVAEGTHLAAVTPAIVPKRNGHVVGEGPGAAALTSDEPRGGGFQTGHATPKPPGRGGRENPDRRPDPRGRPGAACTSRYDRTALDNIGGRRCVTDHKAGRSLRLVGRGSAIPTRFNVTSDRQN